MDLSDFSLFDIEADGLNPTKIYVLAIKDEKGSKSTTNYDNMRKFFLNAKILVGHNITRYDIPVVERILNIKIKARLIDTLALSWYLYPNMVVHGLDNWGKELGIAKPKIDDWLNLSIEEYTHRCEEDVKINSLLWDKMWKDINLIYNDKEDLDRFLHYLQFKMNCAREQERSKWKVDRDELERNLPPLIKDRDDKVEALIRAMPPVKIFNKRSRPAKPYKKDGTLSSIGARWNALCRLHGVDPNTTEEIKELVGTKPGNPASSLQLKSWLYSLGWKPQTFKYERQEDGSNREIPQINLEHGAGICPSISRLYSIEPALSLLEGLGVLNHRISLLSGILDNLLEGDYSQAQIAGLTNTLRFKHKMLVNLPKVNKPYGELIRGVLIAPEGYELCGSDMSGLEDRLKQHYIYPHDPDYVNEMLSDDYDPHLSLALLGGSVTQEQIDKYNSGEDKSIKPTRDIFKNGNYACQYGAGAAKLSLTADISLKEAKRVWEIYWKKNWAIKVVAKEQIWKLIKGQMWLLNPVSKFWYSLRLEKDIFSTLVQGTASYVFDLWVEEFRKVRPQLTGQFHDEVVLCIKKGFRHKAEALLTNAIDKVNKDLKLNRELAIDIQFGDKYSSIH